MKKTISKRLKSISGRSGQLLRYASFLLAFALMHLTAMAQPGSITGRVTNGQGQGVAGVTVQVKNGTAATATDAQGNFTLSATSTDVLQFSSVGYATQEIPVNGRSSVEVTFQTASNTLNDVVVVGYTTQRKRDLTGSVSTVNARELVGLPVGDAAQILQGKVAGVTVTQNTGAPGGGVRVQIRGVGSPNGTDPLYVIDGVPTADGINRISPSDIETFSVLKDASAAAIYGARGSNGVVIVTTKKGRVGKPKLGVDIYTGVQTPANLIKMANTRQYVAAFNTAAAADGRQLIPVGMLDTLPDVNWQKEVLSSAPLTNVQLSLSGGSENTRYLVSASYFMQDGMIENSSSDRFNLRTNLDSRINKIFRVGTNLNLGYQKLREVGSSGDGFGGGNAGASVLRYALFRTPATPVYDNAGNYVDIPNPAGFFGDGLNPVALAANTDRAFRTISLLGDVFLEVNPIKNLRLRSDFGTDFSITDYRQFYGTWGSPARLQNSPASLSQSNTNNYNYNWTNTATYDWTMNKHAFNFLLGSEIIYGRYRSLNAGTSGFANQSPSFQYLSNGTSITPSIGGGESSASLSSAFGRVDYQYDQKYIAAINVRRDGSSRLDPSDRWGTFVSGSLGWRIDRENFMQNVKAISSLKLRGSYGQVGNQNANSNYSYTSLIGSYGYYPFGSSAAPAATIFAKGNTGVRWETTNAANIGLDVGVLKNDLSFSVDYYIKRTRDLLQRPLDPTSSGSVASAAVVNNGKVLNRGFEFEVNYQKQLSRDWNFGVNANLSTIHNEVTSLLNNQIQLFGRVDNGANITALAVGQPIGAFYLLEQEGIFQNNLDVFTHARQAANVQPGDVKFKDQNGDGVIDEKDRVFSGSAIPKLTYAFTGNVSYKAFDLSLFFQGVEGNKIYSQVNMDIEGFYRAFGITERAATQAWHGEGTSNEFPRLSWIGGQNNKQASTRFLQDGSYLRLKNTQLGYTFQSKTITRLKISSMRVYVAAQNLLTFTKYTGSDPELTSSANANAVGETITAAGIDWGTYPSSRTFTVGINANF